MFTKDDIKAKVGNLKDFVKEKTDAVKGKIDKFNEDHPDVHVIVSALSVPLAITVVTGIASNMIEAGANDALLVEDDITGLDFKTKHPMTNKEILELGDRMSVGQSKGDALNEMGLLKKERKRR